MTPLRRSPYRTVRLCKKHGRKRLLTEEYRWLGAVLDKEEADSSVTPAEAATRLLLLTRCRKNESVTLRWDDIDHVAAHRPSRARYREGVGGERERRYWCGPPRWQAAGRCVGLRKVAIKRQMGTGTWRQFEEG